MAASIPNPFSNNTCSRMLIDMQTHTFPKPKLNASKIPSEWDKFKSSWKLANYNMNLKKTKTIEKLAYSQRIMPKINMRISGYNWQYYLKKGVTITWEVEIRGLDTFGDKFLSAKWLGENQMNKGNKTNNKTSNRLMSVLLSDLAVTIIIWKLH